MLPVFQRWDLLNILSVQKITLDDKGNLIKLGTEKYRPVPDFLNCSLLELVKKPTVWEDLYCDGLVGNIGRVF